MGYEVDVDDKLKLSDFANCPLDLTHGKASCGLIAIQAKKLVKCSEARQNYVFGIATKGTCTKNILAFHECFVLFPKAPCFFFTLSFSPK